MNKLRPFAFAFLTSTVLLGQKYEIHLTPRTHAGDVFLFSAKGLRSHRTSAAGQVLSKEDLSVEFEARAEVLDVDDKAEPVRIAFTVSRFTKSENSDAVELLKPGSVILVDGSAGDPVSLKGGAMNDAARRAFDVVYAPRKPGAVSDDEVFGTKDPKAIGESWPLNSKLAAEDLKRAGVEIPPELLLGSTGLTGKDRIGDTDCLSVRAALQADGFAMKDLPSGVTMDDLRLQATFHGCVPIHGKSVRKGMEFTLTARMKTSNATVDLLARQESMETWKDVGK